jgi:uncharacterized protein YndB with AHSA1/START domain
MPKRKNSPPPANRVLEITRIFNAPRALVFAAWTEGQHLKRWCCPKHVTIISSEGDCRPGGAWRSCMLTPDGTRLPLSGEYREVVPVELLSFTHAWEENGQRGHETLVTVRFSDYGKKTKMHFRQAAFDSVGSRDGHAGGWNQCFDHLKDYLAALPTPKKSRVLRK